MYESFYGLKGRPFKLTPDPSFFYASSTHAKGLAYLHYGLQQGEGFVVVTGMPGTGKTTLLNILMRDLSPDKFVVVKLSNTLLDIEELFRTIAQQLKLKSSGCDKVEFLEELELRLQQLLRTGKRVLLLIDEAHNLSPRILEEFRLLSNFQYRDKYTLQIFLLGQFQLEETLNLPEMLQLRQRVLVSHRLECISLKEIGKYINHRLAKAGWKGTPAFSGEAFRLIHHYTEGIPRQINTLSDRVLLYSYLDENPNCRKYIDVSVVNHVIDELKHEPASYVYGHKFSEIDLVSKENRVDDKEDVFQVGKYPMRSGNGFQRKSTGKPSSEEVSNVVAWPSGSLGFHQIDAMFPVDRSYPNALKITNDDALVLVESQGVLAENLLDDFDDKQVEAILSESETTINVVENDLPQAISSLEKDGAVEIIPDQEHEASDEKKQSKNFLRLNTSNVKRIAAFSGVFVVLLVIFILDWMPSESRMDDYVAEVATLGELNMQLNDDVVLNAPTVALPISLQPEAKAEDVDLIEEEEIVVLSVDSVPIVSQLQHHKTDDEKKNVKPIEITANDIAIKKEIVNSPKEKHTKTAKKQNFPVQIIANTATSPKANLSTLEKANIDPKSKKQTDLNKVKSPVIVESKELQPMKKTVELASIVSPGNKADMSSPKRADENNKKKQVQLKNLIDRFVLAYQEGDIRDFISLFSPNVESDDSTGIVRLENEYKKLFNVTDIRRLEIDDFFWEQNESAKHVPGIMSGESDFQLTIVEKGGGQSVIYEGEISLEVDMNQPKPVITQIYYSYDE